MFSFSNIRFSLFGNRNRESFSFCISDLTVLIDFRKRFAGRVFVGNLKQFTSDDLKEMKAEIEKGFDGYDFPAKQVMAISTLLLADKLATDFIFKDGRELTVEDVVDIPTRKKDVSEGQRCYEFILESLSVYGQHFDAQFSCDQWGFKETPDEYGDVYVYFYPKPLENLLKNNGFSRKAFSAWAINRELVKHTGKRDTVLKRDGGSVMRLIAVKIVDIKNLENEQENEVIETGFLPADAETNVPFS